MSRDAGGRGVDSGMPPRARRTTAAASGRRRETWQADLVPVAITIGDAPDARPALCLVMCDGLIIHGDVVAHPPNDAPGVAAEIAAAIQAGADATKRRPGTVEVRHSDVAIALGAILQASHLAGNVPAVRVAARMPDMDDAMASFDESVAGRPAGEGPRPRVSHPDTWAGWKLPRDQIARLFTSAARYFQAAPWKLLVNDDMLRVAVPGGATWSAIVMGNANELFGLALYADHGDLLAALNADSPEEAIAELQGAVLSLSFGPKDDLSPRTRKEILLARWNVAGPTAYPDLMAINTLAGGVTERQMDDLIAALGAICRFATAHAARLRDTFDEPTIITWTDEESGVEVGLARAIV